MTSRECPAIAGWVLLTAALTQACGTPREPASVAGRWHGTLGEGADTVGFFIDLDLGPGGGLLAEADIPVQGIQDLPLGVEARGDSLFLRLGKFPEGAEWRGQFAAGGTKLTGELSQAGRPFPLDLRRVGDPRLSEELQALHAIPAESLRVELLSSDARELREAFNAGRDRVRLVTLLSPT